MLQLRYITTLPAICTRQRRRWNLLCFQRLALMKQSLARSMPALILLIVTALSSSLAACVKQSRARDSVQTPVADSSQPRTATPTEGNTLRININTASTGELQRLPSIGKVLAARIIEHREKYGPFRRPEHLLMVRGISDRRFRALRELITVQ